MAFVPPASHLVAFGFLLTGLILSLAGAGWLLTFLTGRRALARKLLLAGVVVGGVYAALLLGNSVLSKEQVLALGQQKYFCELDCHLAYSITGVTAAKTLGSGNTAATANGEFLVVKLKTWFDEDTISPRRPKGAPLSPNPRALCLLDDQGREYGLSLAGMKALSEPAGNSVPLIQPLQPGESYETTLVFDVPADARNPRLFLTDPVPINWVLIGHENSFFHKKVYFDLKPATPVASAHP